MPDFSIRNIEVQAIRPPAAELRRRAQRRTVETNRPEEPSYVVKIHLDPMPAPDDLGYELHIGDRLVRSYAAFDGGIYFTVEGPDQLARLDGRPVRLRRPDGSDRDGAEAAFPQQSPTSTTDQPDATTSGRFDETAGLPTLDEVVRR